MFFFTISNGKNYEIAPYYKIIFSQKIIHIHAMLLSENQGGLFRNYYATVNNYYSCSTVSTSKKCFGFI